MTETFDPIRYSIITEKTSITEKQLKKYVNGEWYLNPEQALKLGLVHMIR